MSPRPPFGLHIPENTPTHSLTHTRARAQQRDVRVARDAAGVLDEIGLLKGLGGGEGRPHDGGDIGRDRGLHAGHHSMVDDGQLD